MFSDINSWVGLLGCLFFVCFFYESFQSNLKYLSVGFRKDQIEKEEDAAKRWAEKWGFLKTPLEEVKLNGI